MRACQSSDVAEGGRLVVDIAGQTIGVFRVDGQLYAYENVCPHQGGPVCQGTLLPRVVEGSNGFDFDPGDPHIVCPWHGFEFSIRTGQHAATPRFELTAVSVHEDAGEIHVEL